MFLGSVDFKKKCVSQQVEHIWIWKCVYDAFTCVTWPIRMCNMTHSHVWYESFTCVTWLIHMCDTTHSHVRHDSFTCVTWLTRMFVTCNLNRRLPTRISSFIYMCDMTQSHVWHDPFACVTWLIHMCDMTHSHVWHDSPACAWRASSTGDYPLEIFVWFLSANTVLFSILEFSAARLIPVFLCTR